MPAVTVSKPGGKTIRPDFEEIYREYAPMVYRTAKGVLGNSQDAVWMGTAFATIELADDGVQRVSGKGSKDVHAGAPLAFGEVLRSNAGAGAIILLDDGLRIEMRSKSEFVLEAAGDGVRIQLNAGSVIVIRD